MDRTPDAPRQWIFALSSVIPLLYLSGGFFFAARFPGHALARGWIDSAVAVVIMEAFIAVSGLLYAAVLREEDGGWRSLGALGATLFVLAVLYMFWRETGATTIVAGAVLVMLGRSIATVYGNADTRHTLRFRLYAGMWLLGMSAFGGAFLAEIAPQLMRVSGAVVYLGCYYLAIALIDIAFPFLAVRDMRE
jgi:hypothetical protein